MPLTLTKLHPMWPAMDVNYSSRFGRLFEQMLESPLQREESGSLLGQWGPSGGRDRRGGDDPACG